MRENLTSGSMRGSWRGAVALDQSPTLPGWPSSSPFDASLVAGARRGPKLSPPAASAEPPCRPTRCCAATGLADSSMNERLAA